jgi:hypothetical protein
MTGLSRTQLTRLVAQEHSEVQEAHYQRHRFASHFTRGDIELLAKVDEAHETLSGPPQRGFWNVSLSNTRTPITNGSDLGGAYLQQSTTCACAGITGSAG